MKIGVWRLSNHKMVVKVKTDENMRIIEAAPIVQKFRGQPLDNLARWMRKQGDVDVMCLRSYDEGPVGK